MPSSTTSSKPVPTTTGRQNGSPAPPATTSSQGDSKNTVSDPPSKTPTKDNSQSSKTGGSSSSGTTKAVASDAADSKPTASGGGKKGSTAPKQSVSSTVEGRTSPPLYKRYLTESPSRFSSTIKYINYTHDNYTLSNNHSLYPKLYLNHQFTERGCCIDRTPLDHNPQHLDGIGRCMGNSDSACR
jgi:hypothetical protein